MSNFILGYNMKLIKNRLNCIDLKNKNLTETSLKYLLLIYYEFYYDSLSHNSMDPQLFANVRGLIIMGSLNDIDTLLFKEFKEFILLKLIKRRNSL